MFKMESNGNWNELTDTFSSLCTRLKLSRDFKKIFGAYLGGGMVEICPPIKDYPKERAFRVN